MSPPKAKFLKRSADEHASNTPENDGPPRSKRKRTEDPSTTSRNGNAQLPTTVSPSIADIDRLVDALVDQVSKLKDYQPPQEESGKPTSPKDNTSEILRFASRGLLQLRGWQRQLLDRYSAAEAAAQKQSSSCQKQDRSWMTLQYEKSHLKQEIANIQNFTMPHMDKVLQQESEQVSNQSNDAMEVDQDTAKSPNGADRLSSMDLNNSEQRTAILQHLRHQVRQRSELVKKRDELQEKLSAMKRESQKLHDVLDRQLPKQLNNLEHASKPLQQWFALPTIGTERTERLQKAQQLPPPLYTLFVSLQEHLDLVGTQDQQNKRAQNYPEAIDSSPSPSATPSLGLRVVPTIGGSGASYRDKSKQSSSSSQQPHELQWTLPVPDITAAGASFHAHQPANTITGSNNNNSRKQARTVTIHFQHYPDAADTTRCIRATASGCPFGLDQHLLLSHLFPHEEEDTTLDEAQIGVDSNGSKRHPYYGWCHYLAGIHLTTPSNPTNSAVAGGEHEPPTAPTPATTRAIIRTLQRKIRANATLKYILQSLQQHKKIPNLPRTDLEPGSTAPADGKSSVISSWQLVMFAQLPQSDKHSSLFTFDLHCKNKTTPRLDVRALVEIDKARYPEVPPRWTLTSSPASDTSSRKQHNASPPLHNAAWKMMEKSLNHDLLSMLPTENGQSPTTGASNAANESSLLFAEWILVGQFHKLLKEWEQVAAASASRTTNGIGARPVKGRDRVPTNLSRT
eukprot:CAMPEP_0168722752 /NCGR_PEP_ID=MMETSP0724-20121128/2759_1 /TAXON_ID=265536 /ORGANISM="Amphiprora sp., Strain CCMP467" /LENGTH=737 /DNA_ID=CAMNT_0008769433 /DNA_START=62 /DNA_END=2275 /DNA_ORIENTATION=+